MKADRKPKLVGHDSKDVPRFAPNFSIYLLPSDVVCLYSEDRKFFLHGGLYCALANEISRGKKSFGTLLRELSRTFPSDKIVEALNRLIERGFVVTESPFAGPVAGYWMSLGLPLETAAKNFRDWPIGIKSLDGRSETKLAAAITNFGARIVKRSPRLTVISVTDYLDARLIDANRRHLSDQTPWLLVQTNGNFPLVGPLFRPGEGPCWACLAERMQRNREVKAFLDRGPAHRVATSPLAHEAVGQIGIQLAAVEIAKAVATGFRTDLNDHIVSVDLLGSTIAKHYVAKRPQCPACGSKKLRGLGRPAHPIELGPGEQLVMTSGGYRTVTSRSTVERFRKHVSPLTGVISRLERINTDLPLNTNYLAIHNFSAPAETVDQLRAGLGGGSFGKGSTAEQGEASALMEAIERYSGIFQADDIRMRRRFADFSAGEAIAPNDVLLFSDTQYRQVEVQQPQPGRPQIPPRFDPSAKIEWSPAWSLRDQRNVYLPTTILYFFYNGPGAYLADSNGCAAGNTLAEAIIQGFLELVERDAYAIWWYNRLQRPQVKLDSFDDPYVRDLRSQLASTGRQLWVLDVTSDLNVPTFVAITHWVADGRENVEFGSGAHFDPRIALLRAMTELSQFLSIGRMGCARGDNASLDGTTPLRLHDHRYLMPHGESDVGANSDFGRLTTREQALACVNLCRQNGLDFLVLDQTRADIGVPVVRVIVPGLRHFYRRFAPGRLYDVPVKLSWRDQRLAEHELNPIHPHT
ncbi:MAG: TOMM precursor leader peptide-binding protein [Hyphomicrobiales bacterium]|nr:TOMM precursor leader peptide-binding protein [Hyphomicrobiales bacterium]